MENVSLTCQKKKNGEETYKQIIEMRKNNDYTTGNLLDNEYFSKICRLIAIDLSKQIDLENPDLKHQINFIGRLQRNGEQRCFSSLKSQKKQLLNFHKML